MTSSLFTLAVVFTPLLGYLGQFAHNGRVLTVAALVMSCGSFTMMLPHLVADPYILGSLPVETCDVTGTYRTHKVLFTVSQRSVPGKCSMFSTASVYTGNVTIMPVVTDSVNM